MLAIVQGVIPAFPVGNGNFYSALLGFRACGCRRPAGGQRRIACGNGTAKTGGHEGRACKWPGHDQLGPESRHAAANDLVLHNWLAVVRGNGRLASAQTWPVRRCLPASRTWPAAGRPPLGIRAGGLRATRCP